RWLAVLEQPVAPALRLEDQIAARGERAVRAEEAVVLVTLRGRSAHRPAARAAQRRAAHPDRVDLVDEDDALAAPLGGELLRLAGEEPHDDGVDAEERLREPGARDRDERRVEAGRDRLREHRLPRAGRSQEEEAALAFP